MSDPKTRRPAWPRRKAAATKTSGAPVFDGITLTSPDRVYYPDIGLTKLGVAQYYETVAEFMLPYVVRRPISLVRCPEGIDGEHFFQRHAMKGMSKAVKQVPIPGGESRKPYLYIDDEEGLFALVQIGVLEIHDWGVALPKVSQPDHIVFDLDPDEDLDFPILKAAAVEVRDFLAELGFKSFLKATGGKGLHVVAPLTPKLGWDEVKGFAKAVADALATARPDRYTANMAKKVRTGRIFVDYLRNQRGGTAICNYSTRARKRRAGGRAAPLGRVEGSENSRALYGEDAAGAAESLEARPVGGIFFDPPVDHGQGQEGARAGLGLRCLAPDTRTAKIARQRIRLPSPRSPCWCTVSPCC